jgi:hypothetical protein
MKAGTVAISFRGLSYVPNRNAFHGNELIDSLLRQLDPPRHVYKCRRSQSALGGFSNASLDDLAAHTRRPASASGTIDGCGISATRVASGRAAID